ncbi:MAG: lipid-A-disaccharide synthase [Planctomycetota bacterium]
MPRLMVCAGEPSGDLHGARLVKECLQLCPDLEVDAIGGSHLAESGARLRADRTDKAVMGWLPVLAQLGSIIDHSASFVEEMMESPPDHLVVIDYPGLHSNLASMARRSGIPVTYYICPQVWAWAPWRMKRIAQCADQLLVVIPFEEQLYSPYHPRVIHVGNPVFDHLADGGPAPEIPGASGDPILALLPGSRRQELIHGLPALVGAACELKAERPDLEIWVSCQREELRPIVEEIIGDRKGFHIHSGEARALQSRARLAIVCSGTATLETAWHGVPMVVAYPANDLQKSLFSLLSVAPYFSLVNLFAGEEIVPERLVDPGDGGAVARLARPLLDDSVASLQVSRLERLKSEKFHPGASLRAARSVLRQIPGSGVSLI